MANARIELFVDEEDGTRTTVVKSIDADTILSKDLLMQFLYALHGTGFHLPDDLEDRISGLAE